MNDDRKAEAAILWGMAAVLVIAAIALISQGMFPVGIAILVVSVPLAAAARAASRSNPDAGGKGRS
jgi:hypothetical protein